MNLYSQGDINFFPFEGKIEGEKVKHDGSFAVAFGEVTMHAHRVSVANPDDMEIRKVEHGYILVLKSEATLTHEDHIVPEGQKVQTLPPGIYRTDREREIDYLSSLTRRVID